MYQIKILDFLLKSTALNFGEKYFHSSNCSDQRLWSFFGVLSFSYILNPIHHKILSDLLKIYQPLPYIYFYHFMQTTIISLLGCYKIHLDGLSATILISLCSILHTAATMWLFKYSKLSSGSMGTHTKTNSLPCRIQRQQETNSLLKWAIVGNIQEPVYKDTGKVKQKLQGVVGRVQDHGISDSRGHYYP